MTNIPKYSVQYPVTVLMFFLGMILLGLISFTNLPINLFPDIRYPRITVVTETQGLAPEEVERRISEPLERLMAGIRNVQQVSSISRADQSVVMVDFVWGADMDFALLDVKKASGDLREEYVSMNVLRFDPNAQPILTLGLTGGDSLLELKRLGEKTLKPTLEKVEGVAEAEIAGGVRPEVRIEVDAGYLSAYGFTVESVIAQLQNANINATGGWIEDANQRLIVAR
jgi:HAE1 family hydrophobic/amphiphilic exporter-1